MPDVTAIAIYKIGDLVRLRCGARLVGTVTEVREPVTPDGHVMYRLRIPMDPEPLWVPARQEEIVRA